MSINSTIEGFILDRLILGDRQSAIDPEKSLIDSGILDSLALVELITYIEEQFGVTVKPKEVFPENFQTINAISAFVESKLSGR